MSFTGLPEATIRWGIEAGHFPAPVRRHGHGTEFAGWTLDDILDWIDNLTAA